MHGNWSLCADEPDGALPFAFDSYCTIQTSQVRNLACIIQELQQTLFIEYVIDEIDKTFPLTFLLLIRPEQESNPEPTVVGNTW